jgi:hypothetical protein
VRRLLLLVGALVAAVVLWCGAAGGSFASQGGWRMLILTTPTEFTSCEATDINNQAWVVGQCGGGKPAVSRAFLWRNGNIRSLSGSRFATWPWDVNNRGQVVGELADAYGPEGAWADLGWRLARDREARAS